MSKKTLHPTRSGASRRSSGRRRSSQLDVRRAEEEAADSNPAAVPPASSALPDQTDEVDTIEISNPAGQTKEVRNASAKKLDKTQVGWRRVVRNFSPSYLYSPVINL